MVGMAHAVWFLLGSLAKVFPKSKSNVLPSEGSPCPPGSLCVRMPLALIENPITMTAVYDSTFRNSSFS
jgi:hypothetical protein